MYELFSPRVVQTKSLALGFSYILCSHNILAAAPLTPREAELARAAGEYYSMILLARDFRQYHRCGQIDIDPKWTDIARARDDLFAKFSEINAKELSQNWSELDRAAADSAKLALNELQKPEYANFECSRIQQLFWMVFHNAVKKWEAFKL